MDGCPDKIYLSQHANDVTFSYGDKPLLAATVFHPEIFAVKGLHGLYPDASRHIDAAIFNGDFLADDTGYGMAWDTWPGVHDARVARATGSRRYDHRLREMSQGYSNA